MDFNRNSHEEQFRRVWEAVRIVRPVHYSLFTFGESELPYYLVVDSEQPREPVQLSQGEVRVTRPTIITPDSQHPELQGFFEDSDAGGLVDFILARTAAFSHLKLRNTSRSSDFTSDSVEEVVARLNTRLDAEEEDRVAVLTAPHGLAGAAIFKYATERIMRSAPDNVQELRERGFLP